MMIFQISHEWIWNCKGRCIELRHSFVIIRSINQAKVSVYNDRPQVSLPQSRLSNHAFLTSLSTVNAFIRTDSHDSMFECLITKKDKQTRHEMKTKFLLLPPQTVMMTREVTRLFLYGEKFIIGIPPTITLAVMVHFVHIFPLAHCPLQLN